MIMLALVSVFVLAVAPVRAERGSGDDSVSSNSGSGSSSSSDVDSDSEDVNDDNGTDGAELETHSSGEHMTVSERRAAAVLKVKSLRESRKSNISTEKRQKVCENHLKAINNKLKAFNQAADKHLNRLKTVFTKVKDYQSAKNFTFFNYDDFVLRATEKQTAATEAVQALKDLGTTIDCSVDDPAASLQTVKSAAADTRTALKDYRKALKQLVVALNQAKSDDSSDDGGAE
jgi:hypothetical protein